MTSSSPIAALYFQRAAGLIAQSTLLVSGTVLFAFGMLELFNVIALIALAIVWLVQRPATTRLLAAVHFHQHKVGDLVRATGHRMDTAGTTTMTETVFTSLWAFRARARARKALSIPGDRFDMTFSVITTLVWLSYFGFISSVLAGG